MEQLRVANLDVNIKVLYYLGLWRPNGEPRTWPSTCRNVFIYVLYANSVYQILVTYFVDIYTSLDDPAGCMEDLIYVLQFFVALSKMATIFYQNETISTIYLTLKDMRAQYPSEDEYEVDLMKKVDLICNLLSGTTVTVFNMFCLFFNVSFFIMLGLPHRRLQARGWFPYDEKGAPAFELTYLGLGVELHVYATMIAASDVLFVCWLVNIIGQLKLINYKFLNIRARAVENIERRDLSEERSRIFQENLIRELPVRGLGDVQRHSRTLHVNPSGNPYPAAQPGIQGESRIVKVNRNFPHSWKQEVQGNSRAIRMNRNLPYPGHQGRQGSSRIFSVRTNRNAPTNRRQRNLGNVVGSSMNMGRRPSVRTLEEGRGSLLEDVSWERNAVRIRSTENNWLSVEREKDSLSRRRMGLRDTHEGYVWWRIKSLQDRREEEKYSKKLLISAEMKRLFIDNVRHHQTVLTFWAKIGSTFNSMLMFQIICYLGLTALISYYIALIPHVDAKAIGMIQVMMGSVIELFISCFLATMITTECSNVHESVYACAWLDATTEFKKSMNIVISMANKPIAFLVAGYLEVSLELFSRATKTSYSLFTTINTLMAVVARSASQENNTDL